jgi:hypothetical protein
LSFGRVAFVWFLSVENAYNIDRHDAFLGSGMPDCRLCDEDLVFLGNFISEIKMHLHGILIAHKFPGFFVVFGEDDINFQRNPV